jgi:hypothetical protein
LEKEDDMCKTMMMEKMSEGREVLKHTHTHTYTHLHTLTHTHLHTLTHTPHTHTHSFHDNTFVFLFLFFTLRRSTGKMESKAVGE